MAARQKYWWVSHKQTAGQELDGGYIWSPKTEKGGRKSRFYDHMMEVRPADAIVSYSSPRIAHVGTVLSRAYTAKRPSEFGDEGAQWDEQGWRINVAWAPLPNPLAPKDVIDRIRGLLPEKYSPVHQDTGIGRQAYLFEVQESLYQLLFELMETSPGSNEQSS